MELDFLRHPQAVVEQVGQAVAAACPRLDLELDSIAIPPGPEGEMEVGDEYVVRMAGPWDGPVRVAATGDDRFRLATLEGHLEAGQIEFRARREDGVVVFEIESWARSKDKLTDLLYDRLRMSKETQLHMWVSTLEHVVDLSGGRRDGRLSIETRQVPEEALDG